MISHHAHLPTCLLALTLLIAPAASASVTIGADHYTFSNISQASTRGSSDTPYGSYSASGDTLSFQPSNFGVSSTNGTGIQFLDGSLLMMIDAKPGQSINQITANESGNFSLTTPSTGTAATAVSISSTFTLQVLAVDNTNITPFIVQSSGVFSPGHAFDIVNHPGQNQSWSGSNTIDLTAALRAHGIAHGQATSVVLVVDNSMLASSESDSTATISKKTFTLTPTPEPASFVLLALGSACLLLRRRKATLA